MDNNNGIIDTVDAVTRARAGSLAAHGLSEQAIADILLITIEQSIAIKNCVEYKNKYAEVADEQIQRQLDLADGWDAIEEQSLKQILGVLEYNRDPKYLLFAAKTANAAIRRRNVSGAPKVIDGSKNVTNIITLHLNKTFIQNKVEQVGEPSIDITPRSITIGENKKIVDLPSPAAVENLLAPVKNTPKDRMLTELEQAFETAGVFKDDVPA